MTKIFSLSLLFFIQFYSSAQQNADISSLNQTELQAKYQQLLRSIYTTKNILNEASELLEVTNKLYTEKNLEYFNGYYSVALNVRKVNPRQAILYNEVAIKVYDQNFDNYDFVMSDDGIVLCLQIFAATYGELGLSSFYVPIAESYSKKMERFSPNTRSSYYNTLGDAYLATLEYGKALSCFNKVRFILDKEKTLSHKSPKDLAWKKDYLKTIEPINRDTRELMYNQSMGNFYYFRMVYDSAIPFLVKQSEYINKFNELNTKNVNFGSNVNYNSNLPFGKELKDWQRENIKHLELSQNLSGENLPLIYSLIKCGKNDEALKYVKSDFDKAEYYYWTKELDKSEEVFQQLFKKIDEFKNSVHYKWAPAHWRGVIEPMYLQLQCARGNFDYVLVEYQKKITRSDELLKNDFAYFSENEKKEYFKNYTSNLNNYYSALLAYSEQKPNLKWDILNKSLQTKSLVMEASSEQELKFKNVNDNSIKEDIKKIAANREKLNAFNQIKSTDEGEYINDSINYYSNAINLLQKKVNTALGLTSYSISEITWKDIQVKLKPTEAYVEIIKISRENYNLNVVTNQYWAFVIKPVGTPQSVLIGEGKEFENGLMEYQRKIWNEAADSVSYNLFWKNIANEVKGSTRLYLTSDGIYHLINPVTLKNPLSGKFVLDEMELVRLSTGRELVNMKPFTSKGNSVVLLGNPDFNMNRKDANLKVQPKTANNLAITGNKRYGFSTLPGTESEIITIEKYAKLKAKQVNVFSGKNATELNIKKVSTPEVLHLATHGIFENNGESNSLLKSKLILAGAGDTVNFTIDDYMNYEDGFLTAYEVTQMNLNNTKLVTLSACETGLGDVQSGEGVWGLQRAFQIAGARCILGSLWAISDEATAYYMDVFYKTFFTNGSVKLSYQTAMKETRKKYPHPYFWGAFVLNGMD